MLIRHGSRHQDDLRILWAEYFASIAVCYGQLDNWVTAFGTFFNLNFKHLYDTGKYIKYEFKSFKLKKIIGAIKVYKHICHT